MGLSRKYCPATCEQCGTFPAPPPPTPAPPSPPPPSPALSVAPPVFRRASKLEPTEYFIEFSPNPEGAPAEYFKACHRTTDRSADRECITIQNDAESPFTGVFEFRLVGLSPSTSYDGILRS